MGAWITMLPIIRRWKLFPDRRPASQLPEAERPSKPKRMTSGRASQKRRHH